MLSKILNRAAVIIGRFVASQVSPKFYSKITREMRHPLIVDSLKWDSRFPHAASRAMRVLTKEPDTINWIDDNFTVDGIFWDVGACMGNYTIIE